MDDSDGIAADLDAAMARAVAAYRDPWRERAAPGHARTVPPIAAPLIEQPRVPVRGSAYRPALQAPVVPSGQLAGTGGVMAGMTTGHRLGPLDDIPVGEGRAYAVGTS